MATFLKKLFYGLLISLALVVLTFSVVLADVECPPTDTPQPPPTETDVPPPTKTSVPPPTQTQIPPTDDPTPTSPPEETSTPFEPVSEPTPTTYVDPTPTETVAPGVTVTPEKHKKPTPVETLPVTGGGLPPNIALGLTSVGIMSLLGIAVVARIARNGQ